jgi:hypothetical protein
MLASGAVSGGVPVARYMRGQCAAGGAGGRERAGGVPPHGGQHPAAHRQRPVVSLLPGCT